MVIFQIEKLEEYKRNKTNPIFFKKDLMFFKNELLGYILTQKFRENNRRVIKKLAQSKDWEVFKNKVKELKI